MTDWSQVVALYDQLMWVSPTPVVALNRAVAVAELDGPQVALAIVDGLDLASYHPWHATRADLLRRLERYDDARAAYRRAIELTDNEAERTWLTRRLGELTEIPPRSGRAAGGPTCQRDGCAHQGRGHREGCGVSGRRDDHTDAGRANTPAEVVGNVPGSADGSVLGAGHPLQHRVQGRRLGRAEADSEDRHADQHRDRAAGECGQRPGRPR